MHCRNLGLLQKTLLKLKYLTETMAAEDIARGTCAPEYFDTQNREGERCITDNKLGVLLFFHPPTKNLKHHT